MFTPSGDYGYYTVFGDMKITATPLRVFVWGAGGGSSSSGAAGGSGAFVFGQLTGLRSGDRLRVVVGRGGVAGGAAGSPIDGAGGRGTGDGGASGGGYSSIELRRAGSRTWRRVIVAAGGGGAGGTGIFAAPGGAGGLTDGFRGGAGEQINSIFGGVSCPPSTPCTAANGLAASTLGGGGSTALQVGGRGSSPGGNGTLLRGGDAMSPCAGVPMYRAASATPTRSSAPCVGPGGGGGGGLYGGAAGMNGPGGGGSSFVDTGVVLHCELANNANEFINRTTDLDNPTEDDYVAGNEVLNFGESGFFTDTDPEQYDKARLARFFPDACHVETGVSGVPGRRFEGIYPAGAKMGTGGIGGRPGGDGLVVLQLAQGAALPSASGTPGETPTRAPRSPVATRSVTSNPSRSASRTRKPVPAAQ